MTVHEGRVRGLVPVQRRSAAGGSVDGQFEKLEQRLLAEAAGDPEAALAVRSHLAAARARFADAAVRQFLPILVEREVRRSLREAARSPEVGRRHS